MSNLVLLTPDIPFAATRIRSGRTFSSLAPKENLIAKDRKSNAYLNAAYSWGLGYEFDLGKDTAGTTNTRPSDFIYAARADLLKGVDAVTQIRVQGCAQSLFTPGDISGLHCWFDANSGWSASSVASWLDLTETMTVSQGTAGNRPTTTGILYNDWIGIDFDGNDYLSVASPTLAQPNTVIVAVRSDTTSGTRAIIDSDSTTSAYLAMIGGNYCIGSSTNLAGSAVTANATDIVIAEYNGASSKIFVNSGSTPAVTGNAGTNARTGFRIGQDRVAGAPWDGKVFEVIVYNKILSSTERQNVYDYLFAKWKTTPSYSNASFSSATLVGPNSEDFAATFSQSSAFRYWWVYLRANSGTNKFHHSKFWTGRQLDLGRDVEEYEPQVIVDEGGVWRSSSGAAHEIRPSRPRYRYSLSWYGVTDAKVQDFIEYVARNAHRSSVGLYATGNGAVLNSKTLIHCRLIDWYYERIGGIANFNQLFATFEELPS